MRLLKIETLVTLASVFTMWFFLNRSVDQLSERLILLHLGRREMTRKERIARWLFWLLGGLFFVLPGVLSTLGEPWSDPRVVGLSFFLLFGASIAFGRYADRKRFAEAFEREPR